MSRYDPPIKRFLQNIQISQNGCWTWKGKTKPAGYGMFRVNKKDTLVHRFSFEYFKGNIPDGLHIDHLCRNTSCVNPDHLEAVTQRVNTLRGESFSAQKARQTHCIKGHALKESNLYITPDGRRNCRCCRHEADKRRRANV